jgi:glutathione peroxidase-family protein
MNYQLSIIHVLFQNPSLYYLVVVVPLRLCFKIHFLFSRYHDNMRFLLPVPANRCPQKQHLASNKIHGLNLRNYSLRFKMFDTVDFLAHVRPFVLFKNYICINISIFNNELNDRKRINNYLNFLNKTNSQTCAKKSTASNISKRREYHL